MHAIIPMPYQLKETPNGAMWHCQMYVFIQCLRKWLDICMASGNHKNQHWLKI